MPDASVVFAAFAPCLTVDFKLYGCDNLYLDFAHFIRSIDKI